MIFLVRFNLANCVSGCLTSWMHAISGFIVLIASMVFLFQAEMFQVRTLSLVVLSCLSLFFRFSISHSNGLPFREFALERGERCDDSFSFCGPPCCVDGLWAGGVPPASLTIFRVRGGTTAQPWLP